ncbi:hypothetical protein PFISCL1PPCAC_14361, partial [Pristionchus fissidentatus]
HRSIHSQKWLVSLFYSPLSLSFIQQQPFHAARKSVPKEKSVECCRFNALSLRALKSQLVLLLRIFLVKILRMRCVATLSVPAASSAASKRSALDGSSCHFSRTKYGFFVPLFVFLMW